MNGTALRPDATITPLPRMQAVGHVREMQVVAGPKDLVGPDNDGRQAFLGAHPLHCLVAFGLRHWIWISERGQGERFISGLSQRHAVNAGRAHVYEAMNSGGERCPADILSTSHIDGPVVIHRAPNVHHGGKVQHSINPENGRNQSFWLANVTSVNDDSAAF